MSEQPGLLPAAPSPALSRRRLMGHSLAMLAGFASPWAYADQAELQDEVWLDTVRNRAVPVLVRWPGAQAKPQAVLVFSHGLGGKRTGADAWGSAWAKAGFAVVHLQHAGSDAAALKGGFSALRKAMAPEQLLARVADVKFVIDEMQRRQANLQGRWADVPLQRLALAGHSFGAHTVQAVAGQAYPKAGSWSGLDKRVKAFVALSPALGRYESDQQARDNAKAMTRPLLVVSGSQDGEVLNNGETVASRRMVYDTLPKGAKALLWLDGADHLTFAGNEKVIPSNFLIRREAATMAQEPVHHRSVVAITTAWLKEQLLAQPMGTPSALAAADLWLRD